MVYGLKAARSPLTVTKWQLDGAGLGLVAALNAERRQQMKMKIVATMILEGDWLNRSQRPGFLIGDNGQVYKLIEDEANPYRITLNPQPRKRITFTIKEN